MVSNGLVACFRRICPARVRNLASRSRPLGSRTPRISGFQIGGRWQENRSHPPEQEMQSLTPAAPPPYTPHLEEVAQRPLCIQVVTAETSSHSNPVNQPDVPYYLYPLTTIKFFIEGLPILALIDTGSALTLISSKILKHLKHCARYPPKVDATAITGHTVALGHSLKASLQFGSCKTTRWIHEMLDAPYDCILGNDLL